MTPDPNEIVSMTRESLHGIVRETIVSTIRTLVEVIDRLPQPAAALTARDAAGAMREAADLITRQPL